MSHSVSYVNMSARLCVSVLFCNVYICTFQIRCPVMLLLTHTLLCLFFSLSLPFILTFNLSLTHSLSLSLLLSLWDVPLPPLCFFFLQLSFSLPGPGFVESAFLYPLDLAGLEHMQSAFSLYHRYGMTSQCEYYSTVSVR